MIVITVVQGDSDLTLIAQTSCPTRCLAHPLHCGERQANEQKHHTDGDDKFDEGKSLPTPSHETPHCSKDSGNSRRTV
jgi:hypothetical protein